MPHTSQFSLVLHIVHPRWRYHYKLHGINIHLPIYSMSCGSNTIHVLLLLHLFDSLSSCSAALRPAHRARCTWARRHSQNVRNRKICHYLRMRFWNGVWVCARSHLIYPLLGAQQHWPLANTNIRCDTDRGGGEWWGEAFTYKALHICYNEQSPAYYLCRRLAK